MENTTVLKLEALLSPRRKSLSAKGLPSIDQIQARESALKSASEVLKSEFAGPDEQIDQILTLVRPWFVLPQAQRRPTVISLWGMTGVGKSSFIRRLVECLDKTPAFAYVDLGKASDSSMTRMDSMSNFPSSMTRLSGEPCILFFDEIHGVRTVDEMGHDIDRPQLCDFWTLIDSGLVPQSLDSMVNLLNGLIREQRYLTRSEAADQPGFADEYHLDQMITFMELKTSARDLRALALSDPHAFLAWAIEKLELAIRDIPILDFTQALIFTAGNLDEVYGDSFSVNPDDMNAEDLYRRTSQVAPDKIKQALMRRFRPEQVARLGSLQIVFPSLSRAAFQRLIRLRLDSLAKWVGQNFHMHLTFDDSMVQVILHEGVTAAQGARPVLSTITELVEIRLPSWLIQASQKQKSRLAVRFDKPSQSVVCADEAGGVLHAERIKSREEKLPKIPMNEAVRNVITVHEAGHAVVGIAAEGRLPIKVLTGSMAWHRGGPRVEFPPADVLTKECAMTVLTMSLAGMAAEQVMFGDDGFSMGCSSDLQKATDLAVTMVTQCAMGGHVAVSYPDQMHPGNVISAKDVDDRQVEELLEAALDRARKILRAQRPLFLAVVDQLKSNERVTRADIAQTVKQYYKGTKKEVESILKREYPRDLEKLVAPVLKKAS